MNSKKAQILSLISVLIICCTISFNKAIANGVIKAEDLKGIKIGTKESDTIKKILVGPDGNIYAGGITKGSIYDDGSYNLSQWVKSIFTRKKYDLDIVIAKFTPDLSLIKEYDGAGGLLWPKQFGTEYDDDLMDMVFDSNGNLYVTGYTKGSLFGHNFREGTQDVFVVKIGAEGEMDGDRDLKGNRIWRMQFGTENIDVPAAIRIDDKGYAYVGGFTNGDLFGRKNKGWHDAFVVKITPMGRWIWSRPGDDEKWPVIFGSEANDQLYDMALGPDGSVYITGGTWGFLKEERMAGVTKEMLDPNSKDPKLIDDDFFIAKFNSQGDLQWVDQRGEKGRDYGQRIFTHGDSVLAVGVTEGRLSIPTQDQFQARSKSSDIFMLEYSDSGELIKSIFLKELADSNPESRTILRARKRLSTISVDRENSMILILGNQYGDNAFPLFFMLGFDGYLFDARMFEMNLEYQDLAMDIHSPRRVYIGGMTAKPVFSKGWEGLDAILFYMDY